MDYDFGKYKRHNEKGILKGAWKFGAPPIEIEAKNDFEQIDQLKLKQVLLGIVNECYNNRVKSTNSHIDKKITYLKSRYPQRKHFDIERNQWEVSIIKNYHRDFYFYRDAIKDSVEHSIDEKKIVEFITDKALDTIAWFTYNIDKLIFITDFKENLEKSIVIVGLFEKINQSEKIYFKDLFKDSAQYNKVLDLLIKHSVIKKSNSGNLILSNENIDELDPKKLLSALVYLLDIYNYLNTTSKTKMVNALGNSFGIKLVDRTLRNRFKHYYDLADLSTSDYINHFFMIKPLYN